MEEGLFGRRRKSRPPPAANRPPQPCPASKFLPTLVRHRVAPPRHLPLHAFIAWLGGPLLLSRELRRDVNRPRWGKSGRPHGDGGQIRDRGHADEGSSEVGQTSDGFIGVGHYD